MKTYRAWKFGHITSKCFETSSKTAFYHIYTLLCNIQLVFFYFLSPRRKLTGKSQPVRTILTIQN